MYVVDASVFVSRFVSTDVNHARSRDWFRMVRMANSPIFGPNLLLPELSGPISRLVDHAIAMSALGKLLRMRWLTLLEIDSRLARRSADLAADLRLRGADAVYVSVADRLNFPLVTWDAEQLTRGALAIEVRSPDQLLPDGGGTQA